MAQPSNAKSQCVRIIQWCFFWVDVLDNRPCFLGQRRNKGGCGIRCLPGPPWHYLSQFSDPLAGQSTSVTTSWARPISPAESSLAEAACGIIRKAHHMSFSTIHPASIPCHFPSWLVPAVATGTHRLSLITLSHTHTPILLRCRFPGPRDSDTPQVSLFPVQFYPHRRRAPTCRPSPLRLSPTKETGLH
ncbi:hypothetical protein LZ30DRAFT_148936 [Colletotrichum cereale]|nr:hypothetical protein LZ30DRAFT_148936 [Colletotrichum cereale]